MKMVKLAKVSESGKKSEPSETLGEQLLSELTISMITLKKCFLNFFSPKSAKDEKKGGLQNIWSWRKSGCFCEYIFFSS